MTTPTRSRLSIRRQDGTATLQGWWLSSARAVWIALVVLSIVVLFVATGANHHQIEMFTAPNHFIHRDPTRWRAGLHSLGLSVAFYAAYITGMQLLVAVVLAMAGLLIFWRKSNEWIGLVSSLSFVTFGTAGTVAAPTLDSIHSPWHVFGDPIGTIGFTSFFLLGYIFPDGHFVPRWTRWLVLLSVGTIIVPHLPIVGGAFSMPAATLAPGLVACCFAAPIYRYHRMSDPSQRRQIKWAVMGLSLAFSSFVLVVILGTFPGLRYNNGAAVLYDMGSVTFLVLTFSLVPVFLGVAIFRYRLWDIDVLINRALVYGSLTLTVATLYIVCVVGVQFLVHSATGQNSNLAVAISTLAIVALFQPLRRRIQAGIDRRFYRRKYNAAQTLATFNATLRDEVDLEHLSEELKRVVQDTVQPTSVSLWLRNAHRE